MIIKLQSDSRAQLAIDAPREVSIKRLEPDGVEKTGKSGANVAAGKKKSVVVVDHRTKR